MGNGWRYSGIMDAELVATAVCAGFSKEPQERSLVKYANRDLFRPYLPTFQRTQGISFGTLIFWLLVMVALVAGAFFLYKQYLKKEMRATIREEVMLEVESQMGHAPETLLLSGGPTMCLIRGRPAVSRSVSQTQVHRCSGPSFRLQQLSQRLNSSPEPVYSRQRSKAIGMTQK